MLLVLPLLLQGGVLRACQVLEMLGLRSDAMTTIELIHPQSLDANENEDSHGSEVCVCEYQKGLTQPERPVTSATLYLAALTTTIAPAIVRSDTAARGRMSKTLPEPPDARRSLPLLI
jgi:hypothetical protein